MPEPLRAPRLGTFSTLTLVVAVYSVLVPICAALAVYVQVTAEGVDPIIAGVLLTAGILVLAGATILLLHGRIVRPVREVLERVEAIARGELEGRLHVRRGDEMGRLKQAVNEMGAYLLLAQEARVDRAFLQDVVDSMPDGLVVLDANGVVELHNSPFGLMLGYADGATGLSLEQLFGERSPVWHRLLHLDPNGSMDNLELDFVDARGERIRFQTSGAVTRDADGQVSRAVLVARRKHDVDELTRELQLVEDRLAESERFFQNLFDAMGDPITVLSPEGEVLQANRAARDAFGKDVVGRKCYRAFRMRDSVCPDCPAQKTLHKRKPENAEHRVFGNAVTRISTYPLLGPSGEIQAIINHKRDVTQERQLEDLKAAFLAGVSHELRTPLTSIVGFNRLNLKRLSRQVTPAMEGATDRAKHALKTVLDDMRVMDAEGERLGRLVSDVLDLSKLEAGKLNLQLVETEVPPLIDGAIAATAALWRAKGLPVERSLPSDCPPAWADADRISQVLVNLLSNAIKFTSEGRILVRVTYDDTDIRIDVVDTGTGIPREETRYVFEKFRQVDGELQAVGTGLGLPICRELVTLHEGRIWVESRVGEGSTFSFTVLRADRLDESERSMRTGQSLRGW